jgi:uncharacterized protein (TIGR03085 family)
VLTSLVPRPFAHSLAARERDALCDLVLSVGGAGPTMCAGWSVKDLVVHLLVRERRPWSALGAVVPAVERATERTSALLAARDLASLVTQLRSVPLPLSVVDPLLNGMEMFVHHEDVRRAQPSWSPRPLGDADERQLWRAASLLGRLQGRRAGAPLVIESGERRAVLRGGPDPVVVSGPVSEVLLFVAGRASVAQVGFDGSEASVSRVREAAFAL